MRYSKKKNIKTADNALPSSKRSTVSREGIFLSKELSSPSDAHNYPSSSLRSSSKQLDDNMPLLAIPNNKPNKNGGSLPPTNSPTFKVTGGKAKKTYSCLHCPKIFNRPSALETHSYVHTAEKPFQCHSPGCGKQFSVASNLRRHLKIHQKNKSFMHNKITS